MKTSTETLMPYVSPSGMGRKLNIIGHTATIKLQHRETDGHYYVMEVETPAGYGIPPHVHDREDEMIYVLEGEFAIMLGDKNYQVGPGTEIFFPRHVPHAFQNIGSTPGKTVWTIVPGGNFEEFFEELNALPAGPPDMAKVIEIFAKYGMTVLVNPPA